MDGLRGGVGVGARSLVPSGYPMLTMHLRRAAVDFAHVAVGPDAVGSRWGIMAVREGKLYPELLS